MRICSSEDFLADCGAIGPLVFCLEQNEEANSISLDRPFALIGNDPNSDIVLDRQTTPGRFAYLQVFAGRLICVDLQRYDERLTNKRQRLGWLELGQSINAGISKIRLVSGLPATGTLHQQFNLPRITITGLHGETQTFRRPLTLLGSSADCQMRIDSPRVSRFHAALVTVPNRVWVVSLLRPKRQSSEQSVFAIDRGDQAGLRLGDIDLQLQVSSSTKSLARFEQPGTVQHVANGEGTDAMATLAQHFMESQHQMFAQFHETMSAFMTTVGAMHGDLMQMLQREMDRVDRLDKELAELRAQQSQLGLVTANRERTEKPAPRSTQASIPVPMRPSITQASATFAPSTDEPATAEVHAWLSQRVAQLQQERVGVWAKMRNYLNLAAAAQKQPPIISGK